MQENKKELTDAEVNVYDTVIIVCNTSVKKDCLNDCLDGTYWITPNN